MPVRRHRLPAAGSDPAANAREVQRALDGLGADVGDLSASDIAYTPGNAADWTGSPPATVQEALDRIAAALGPI